MKTTIKQITAEETWSLRHKVMWPNESIDYIKLPEDNYGVHFGLFKKQLLVSVISLFIKNDTAQFRKLATLISEQNHGYGGQLLDYIINYSSSKEIKTLWCNARKEKIQFYEKRGLLKTPEEFSKGGIDYVILTKQITNH
ncbi:MAG: GNAT family N-acetyltransferase [Cellulophaga sp.]